MLANDVMTARDTKDLVALYEEDGHATKAGVFTPERMDAAIADVIAWSDEAIAAMSEKDRRWFVDGAAKGTVLRKLDNPHTKRAFFTELASDPAIVELVEALVGKGVSVYFSQIFFKPPHGGGPKPAHQDNFYFGPSDHDGVVTAWIALDQADEENGCLRYGRATHRGPIIGHTAPQDRPFDLQIAAPDMAGMEMRPAPVPKGGVSFHHGGTVHVSADNNSERWRRACAFHYVRNDVVFSHPALPYDHSLVLRVS
ncbi:phytanoyl-CoA dioxygenase family protein [Acuticoccus mangrovi]|uniref:Phytanoyl-CoA dioxygenase family protein n=1 Tax=Acuticoccus mangrovi TaxID=2796142 RepID=A0A934IP84_9HYPH|nr:phytanoyl-CoA dioxygenase family protein [Acuticoccus mangrovi]MBJ3775792.1 phytanoyl-CoA dioxygenase family protein [Acuticoccus mangrovi]